jgi:leucyl-tRNA synthetase
MPSRYEPKEFEAKWRKRWKDADLFRTREDPGREKFYGLEFFPYPSGAGLSVGHLRNYIPSDVLCRMKRMQGFNVLHPMGWDAFGLPAENEAIAKKTHPAKMVREYADTYKRQQELVGISYDWSREINSSSPDFYKWTQWIFQLLYKKGLAYHGDYPANWCPKDKTVLANEEVEGGLCWRCGTPVEKRMLKQWFFRITAYAERLLADLEELDWPEGIKQMQRNWIGRSEGVEFEWRVSRAEVGAPIVEHNENATVTHTEFMPIEERTFRVFTTRIDTVYGATFCVLAPEHPLVAEIVPVHRHSEVSQYVENAKRMSDQDRLAAGRVKTGVFTGVYARNPFTNEHVPIWIADYVLMGYGTGAIMAVPGHDERDYEFAIKHDLEIRQVIAPEGMTEVDLPFVSEDGVLVSSGDFSGLSCEEAQQKMSEWIESQGSGEKKVNYRLRDWLISRQRYWGSPIPVIHTEDREIELVPEEQLPVLLPEVDHYEPTETGESPLSAIPEFVNTTDSKGRPAKRETDTMGGFACSSWYFLRFTDPQNAERAWDMEKVNYWMPVDCYVGGAEHAVMHLLYARFWTKVLYDEGLVPCKEPFAVLRNQGMLLAPTPFRKPRSNETLRIGEEGIQITYEEAQSLPEDEVFWRWEKMSKSKGNVVTPDEAVEKYGADALRVYELFEAPFSATIQWSEERIGGAINFLHRVFKLTDEFRERFEPNWRSGLRSAETNSKETELRRSTHFAIKKVTDDFESFAFNTAVSSLMEFRNSIADFAKSADYSRTETRLVMSEAIETLILLLAPIAPHSADEIWESYGFHGFTYQADWPKFDERFLVKQTVTMVLQVNGKVRANMDVPAGLSTEEAERLALAHEKVAQHTEGKTVRKVIVVPDKVVNVVAN